MTSTAPYQVRKATRDTTDTYLGGVASGLARHLGLPVIWVRVGFVIAASLAGMGVAFYALLWLMLPAERGFPDEAPGLASARRFGKRAQPARRLVDVGPMIALAALGIGVILLFETVFGQGALFWPVVLGIVGIALIWRQADEVQRERWLDTTGRIDPVRALVGDGTWAAYARLAAGVLLIIAGLSVFALRSGQLDVARDVLIAAMLGVIGLAITVGPWIFRLASDLGNERAERVRTQERADVAAHLHDSVLQTLALIQKNSADASTVARLARAQERDLRTWLFEGESAAGTLSAALREIAADVERSHNIVVEVVTVGDVPVTDVLLPLVHATREAVTNAAKHAGVGQVDVYAEVAPSAVELFVKDRGKGFDLERIAGDRQGVRGSIVDRMERHGGSATIKSTPGDGTEVVLRMPLEENK